MKSAPNSSHKLKHITTLTTLLCIASSLLPLTATAQTKTTITLTQIQESLARDAFAEAAKDNPDFEAMRLNYATALRKGEADVLYVGLGWALQQLGKCLEAEQSFQKALTSPNTTLISRDNVKQKIAQYRQESQQICPAEVLVLCETKDTQVTLNGKAAACDELTQIPPGSVNVSWTSQGQQGTSTFNAKRLKKQTLKVPPTPIAGTLTVNCNPPDIHLSIDQKNLTCGKAIKLPPGQYNLRGELNGETSQHNITIKPNQIFAMTMAITPKKKEDNKTIITPPQKTKSGSLTVPAWSLMGTGGAFVLFGVLSSIKLGTINGEVEMLAKNDIIPAGRVKDLMNDADNYELLQLGGLGLGTAFMLAGATLLYLDSDEEQNPAQNTNLKLSSWGSDQGAGVLLQGSW